MFQWPAQERTSAIGVPLGYRSARGTLHKRREEQAEKTKRLRMLRAD